ncbi:MAG UNVERIFIED_CONTAM: hypothetical protein LVR29_20570 [Microcystis novacekii LVE1205-3]
MTIATASLREQSIIFLPRLYNGHRDLLSLLQLGNWRQAQKKLGNNLI